ncbi:virulence factor TspB C-terminal domain-related protein [Comamonas sp. SCN 65-56]|uniref:virulence factor TspB C-terminal domain-related protein n=1 Tax=Comamonas sp. SCN 65-56 TaxID=1660095 RepID=UPI0025B89E06|nr:virulence factor TspB C-terminal domain-related protein [Comamonas sp. SCN 65-56]
MANVVPNQAANGRFLGWFIETEHPVPEAFYPLWQGYFCPNGTLANQAGNSCDGCPSTHEIVGGQCVPKCEANEERGEDGLCHKINPCPSGQHEEGGACVPDNCQPDEIRVGGFCVKEPPCPFGQTRVNGVCKKTDKCKAGREHGERWIGDSTSFYTCEGGCQIVINASFDITYEKDGETIIANYGIARETGAECTGGSGPGDGPGNGPGGGGGGEGDGGGGDDGNGGSGGGGGGSGDGDGGTGGGGGGNPPTPRPDEPAGGRGGNEDTGNLGGSANEGDGKGSSSGISDEQKPEGEEKPPEGCAEGFVERGGMCYETRPKEPDEDGKCGKGYVKVDSACIPIVPTPGGGGGGGDGGGGDGEGGEGPNSSFMGTCMGGFQCEGDAVQCAIAREQHRRNCALFVDETLESKLYEAEKGKEGSQTEALPGNSTVDLTPNINQTDALGGGACVGDKTVSVMGQSITLPFSVLCPYLEMLGNILVAVSLLLAVRIVMRG